MQNLAPAPTQGKRRNTMKVALVHEWLTTYAGSEKVLEVILSEFPDADLFSLIDCLPQQHRRGFAGKTIKTTFLQKIPFVRHFYRNLLPIMPFAIEQFDMSGYDIVISNSHAVAKGVITGPDQLHICYLLHADALCLGPADTVSRRVRHRGRHPQHPRTLSAAQDQAVGFPLCSKRRSFHRLFRLHREAHQEGLSERCRGDLSECRHECLRDRA